MKPLCHKIPFRIYALVNDSNLLLRSDREFVWALSNLFI